MIPEPTRTVEGHSCCFWARNSDKISQIGYAGTGITSALAAITILGGILIILAQQGCSLGAINTFAHRIPSSWIYSSWFISGTLFLLCVGFLTTIAEKTSDQIYTEQEIQEMGLLSRVEGLITSPKSPMRYITFISPSHQDDVSSQTHPAVYAILKRDERGRESLVAFKTEMLLASYISHLHQIHYQQDDEVIWKSREEYTIEEIQAVMNQDKLQRACTRLNRDLPNGFFHWEEIYVDEWHIHCLLFARKDHGLTTYVVKPFQVYPHKQGEEYFPDHVNFRLAQDVALKKCYEYIDRTLVENDYFIYEVPDLKSKIYAVAYRRYSESIEIKFFISHEDRTTHLVELGFEMWS